jgi:hypothetical protein
MSETYPPPVHQLLSLGEPEEGVRDWRDYRALGLADEHVPALLELLEDPRLSWMEWSEGDDQAPHWAPMHAWRALGQLGAPSAVEPLLRVLLRDEDDDWALSEIPRVLAMVGPTARPAVRDALPEAARRPEPWSAGTLGSALVHIARGSPEMREDAVAALTRQLRTWPDQSAELNAFLIGDLTDLHAVEAAPLMREAFEAGVVDESVVGDWEDVQVELGLLAERTLPPPRFDHGIRLSPVHRARTTPSIPVSSSPAAKSRQLRKAQKQAKKKRRK